MKTPSALVAHPYPIVVDALAAIVAAAGFNVTCAGDFATAAAALDAYPDLAVIAASLDGVAAAGARNGSTRTLVIAETEEDGVIALTAPVERLTAVIAALSSQFAETTPSAQLTPRERDVARLVAAGQRNRAIATALGISEGTVKMHLHNVYAKLGLESRTQLAMAAAGLGAR